MFIHQPGNNLGNFLFLINEPLSCKKLAEHYGRKSFFSGYR